MSVVENDMSFNTCTFYTIATVPFALSLGMTSRPLCAGFIGRVIDRDLATEAGRNGTKERAS